MTGSDWKTALLPRLEGFELFPYGRGADGKLPIGGPGWQNRPETAADIAARNGSCPAIALYPSQASGLETFDVDGKSADEYLRNTLGVDPDDAVKKGAWKIWRKSDAYRYKLIFRTDIEEGKKGKLKIETLSREDSPNGKPEQLEWFYGGQGVLIAGLHKDSGDYYQWINGPGKNGKEDIPFTPSEWEKVRACIRAHKKSAVKKTNKKWLAAHVVFGGMCPSCGRDESDDCQATEDGKTLLCHHGGRFSADKSLPVGTHIAAPSGTLILRDHSHENAVGACSLFSAPNDDDAFKAEDDEARRQQLDDFRASLDLDLQLEQVFNPWLASLIDARANSLPADPAAYIAPLLCGSASIVGKRVRVQVKAGWQEPCLIWAGNVMDPSSLKSPISADIRRPLEAMQLESIERCKGNDDDDEANKPRRYCFAGITHAAVVDLLCQPKTIGLCGFYDELASLFAAMEARHNSAMRAELLELWNGNSLLNDTKTAGHKFAKETALSIFGNIQPEKLQALINNDGGDTAGDGLWPRFLWFRPKPTIWKFNENEAVVTEELSQLFSALDRVPSNAILRLSPEALSLAVPQWDEWSQSTVDVGGAENAFLGKLRGYSVRIAGILHLLDIASDGIDCSGLLLSLDGNTIPASAMQRALLLCNFCHKQWRQLQTEIGHGVVPAVVAKFMSRVESASLPSVTTRDVVRWRLLGRNTTSADAAEFLRDVAGKWGYGTTRTALRGGLNWFPS